MNFIVTYDQENAELGDLVKWSMENNYDTQNILFLTSSQINARNLGPEDVIITLEFDENSSYHRFSLDYLAAPVDRKRGDIKNDIDRTQIRTNYWEQTALEGIARVHVDDTILHEEMNLKLFNVAPDPHSDEEYVPHHRDYFAALIQTIIHKRERQEELMMGKFYFGEFNDQLFYANFMGDRTKVNSWRGNSRFVRSPSGRRSELKVEVNKGIERMRLQDIPHTISVEKFYISPDTPEKILEVLKSYQTDEVMDRSMFFFPPVLIAVPHLNPTPNPNYPVFETGVAYGFRPTYKDIPQRNDLGFVPRDEKWFRDTADKRTLEAFGW